MPTVEAKMSIEVGEWDAVVNKIRAAGARPRIIAAPVGATVREEELFCAFVKNVANAMPELKKQKTREMQKRWFDILLQDAFDVTGIPEEFQIEARMEASARARVLQSRQFVPAAKVSALMGSQARNSSSLPNRLKKTGSIFAISHEGEDLYPLYALEKENAFRPYPAIKQILGILQHRRGWALANWFESPNGYLGNSKPREMLRTRSAEVLRAAEVEAEGIQHG